MGSGLLGNFISLMGQECIAFKGCWKENGVAITIGNVYIPFGNGQKRRVWGELRRRNKTSNTKVWCVISDFNSVRRLCDRLGLVVVVAKGRFFFILTSSACQLNTK